MLEYCNSLVSMARIATVLSTGLAWVKLPFKFRPFFTACQAHVLFLHHNGTKLTQAFSCTRFQHRAVVCPAESVCRVSEP